MILSAPATYADAKLVAEQFREDASVFATAVLGRNSDGKLEKVSCTAPPIVEQAMRGDQDPGSISEIVKSGLVGPFVELMSGPLGPIFGWSAAPLIAPEKLDSQDLRQDFTQLAGTIQPNQALVLAESEDPNFDIRGYDSRIRIAKIPSNSVLIELSAILLHADKAIAVARESLREDRRIQRSTEDQGFLPTFRMQIDSLIELGF
ncbi:hypothetical protein CXR23_14730 [Brevibacterium aurantiacum]|nr:hypothetical protein CXR23_14730 [Brevibacterium aurantiacum]